jgi:hypothetical protein
LEGCDFLAEDALAWPDKNLVRYRLKQLMNFKNCDILAEDASIRIEKVLYSKVYALV